MGTTVRTNQDRARTSCSPDGTRPGVARRLTLAAVALGLVAGLGACSSSDDGGSTAKATTTTKVTTSTSRPVRERPEGPYTLATTNTGQAQGKIYAQIYIRRVDRQERTLNQDQLTGPRRERLARIPGITVTNIGVLDLGGSKSIQFSVQGSDLAELERLATQIMARLRDIPGLVDLDSTLKPDKPTLAVDVKRDAAADLGLKVDAIARSLRTLLAGVSVGNWRAADGESYDVRVQLAPESRSAAGDLQQLPLVLGSQPDGSARVVRLSQVAELRPSTGPNQINRRDMNREVNIDANALGRLSLIHISEPTRPY